MHNSCTRVRNGSAPLMPPGYLHLDLPKHVVTQVRRHCLQAHSHAVESSFCAMEMVTTTIVPVLLFKMRCMFFFTFKTRLCALSERSTLSFSSLPASLFLWRPFIFCMPCLVRLSLNSFLNCTNLAISSRTS